VFGAPLALALEIPFFMLRKKGKLPNAVSGSSYKKVSTGRACKSGHTTHYIKTGTRGSRDEMLKVFVECVLLLHFFLDNRRARILYECSHAESIALEL
jgi:hypothetical protein